MYKSRARRYVKKPKTARRYPATRGRRRYAKAKTVAPSWYPSIPARGNMGSTGVPAIMSLQLKTLDNKAVAAATHEEFALKLNSTFDPMGDVSAIQPAGRDQIAALYNSYIVESGAVKLTFVNDSTIPVYVCLYTSAQAAVAQSVNNYGTQPGARYKVAGNKAGSQNSITIIKPFKCSNIVGPLDRSSHGAAVGSDPTTLVYCYFGAWAADGATAMAATSRYFIEVVQNTTFYDKVANVHA